MIGSLLQTVARLAGLTPALSSIEVTGGSTLVVVGVFVLLAIATVLSLLVTYRYARGYLATGARPLLWLAVGLFLLTAAPTFVRLVLANVGGGPGTVQTLVTSTSELLGLLTILYTIYR